MFISIGDELINAQNVVSVRVERVDGKWSVVFEYVNRDFLELPYSNDRDALNALIRLQESLEAQDLVINWKHYPY